VPEGTPETRAVRSYPHPDRTGTVVEFVVAPAIGQGAAVEQALGAQPAPVVPVAATVEAPTTSGGSSAFDSLFK
jgi:hypothetical protein